METVRFYDVDTGTIVTIPASELATGAVRAQVQGVDGIVWLLPEKLEQGDVKHPPFDEEVRRHIREIQAAFAEQRALSFEDWEDGFRRDTNPVPEIAIWHHAADVYAAFADAEASAERRRDAYRCIVNCMIAGPDDIWRVFKCEALSRQEAQAIIDRFYGNQTDPGATAAGGA